MSLKATVEAAIATAFVSAGDLVSSGQVRRITAGEYDPATGKPATLKESWPAEIIEDRYHLREIDGDRVTATDIRLFVRVDRMEPAPGDEVLLAGVSYRVMNAKPIRLGGKAFLFELQVRE